MRHVDRVAVLRDGDVEPVEVQSDFAHVGHAGVHLDRGDAELREELHEGNVKERWSKMRKLCM